MSRVCLVTVALRTSVVARRCGVAVALLAIASSAACANSASSVKSPSDQAAELVRTRCAANTDEAALAPVLDGTAIESVEPLYNQGGGGGRVGQFAQLTGTAITVHALPGISAEWLTLALECHSARRVVGSIPAGAAPNDPFWLPGRTVKIEAQSVHGGFRVEVRGADPAEGRQVLDRAKAFTETASPTATL
jgi:hypothetical protein